MDGWMNSGMDCWTMDGEREKDVWKDDGWMERGRE